MSKEAKTLSTYTLEVLGRNINQYDTRQIARLLEGFGMQKAERDSADLVVAHTCGVSTMAVKKSRYALRSLMRKHSGAALFLTGCAAGEEVIDGLKGVDTRIATGPGWVQRFADELQTFSLPNPDFRLPENAEDLPEEIVEKQTRAFLKVQDGCDAGCTYCIVPQLGKTPRDKSVELAVAEAEALVKRGYKEIVIAGVHVGLYGRDGNRSLSNVLSKISTVPNIGRIRMSSLHPAELTDELLVVWAGSPNVMPHLHLSLQSGSNSVLGRMGRDYTTEDYFSAVNRARSALQNPSITTDVIVGFPGETDAEFEETFDLCKRVGFADMHLFTFSPRPGTRAAEMPDPIAPQLAQERHHRLSSLAREMAATFNRVLIGQTVEVLVERFKDGLCSGVSERHIPTSFIGSKKQIGQIIPVKVSTASAAGLIG